MEPTQRTKFSFTQAAAQQTSRQRFAFAQPKTTQAPPPSPQDLPLPSFGTSESTQAVMMERPTGGKLLIPSVGKEIVQGTARSAAATGSYVAGRATGQTKEEATRRVITPESFSEKALFGQEPFSVQTEAVEPLQQFGASKEASEKYGPPLLIGLTALDALTGGGKKKAVQEALVAAKTPTEVTRILKKEGFTDEVIFGLNLNQKLADAKTPNAVNLVLEAAKQQTTPTPTPTRRFTIQNPPKPKEGETIIYFQRTPGGGAQYVSTDPGVTRRFATSDDAIEAVAVPTNSLSRTGNEIKDASGIRTITSQLAEELTQANRAPAPRRTVFSAALENLRNPAIRQGGYIGTTPEGFPTPKRVPESSVDNTTNQPKIDRRFVNNFPELGSADRMAQIQERTRGVRTNEESLQAARELGWSEERVLRIPEGKALNAEEKFAVTGVVENARLNLKRMEDNLSNLTPGTKEANDLREQIAQQKVRVFRMMAVERGIAAEAGRALQSYRAAATAIEQQERWLSKYLADPDVPQDVKDYIYGRIGEFDGTPNEMSKLLRELNEASKLEMFVEFATAAKLWATQTHIVNMLSSTMRMLANSPVHAVSAVFDSVLSKLKGRPRERFISDAKAEIQGQIQGWKHAGHEAAKALMDENYAFEARKLQDTQPKGPAIKGRPGKNELRDRIMDGFGKAVRTPFRLLGMEDLLIRKPSEMGAMYVAINRMARMKGLKPGTKEWDTFVSDTLLNPSVDTLKRVQEIADENLFQESLHPVLKKVQGWREDVPAIKLVVPFFRTIVNLQKQALQFSALSPILPSTRKAVRAGGGEASDALAKMTLGTVATLPLIYHALEGNITLAAPTNPTERDNFYASGKQPYSIRLGDKWYPYHRFSPWSEWFVQAGAFADAVNNEDERTQGEIASHIFFTMTQNFFDKSFATGMHDLLEALADPERADNWLANFATGATIPNFIPLVARTVDPVVRETEGLKEAYISKIPYLSKTLPARTDIFGEPISRPGSAVERFISPVIPSEVEVDIVRKELEDIGYELGFPGKTAGGFEMDRETYHIYQAAAGKITYKVLSQMIQSPQYQQLTPQQRERAVRKIVNETRDMVKTQVAQEQLIMNEIKAELKRQGYSSKQAEELAVKTYEIIKTKEGGQPSQ